MGDERLFESDATGIVGNPICGDQMKMYIKVQDDTITDIYAGRLTAVLARLHPPLPYRK